jgi:hypothetical protein
VRLQGEDKTLSLGMFGHVFTFDKEMLLMPLDIHGDWVKVQVDGYDIIGWIEAEWLCSNPLTNCC